MQLSMAQIPAWPRTKEKDVMKDTVTQKRKAVDDAPPCCAVCPAVFLAVLWWSAVWSVVFCGGLRFSSIPVEPVGSVMYSLLAKKSGCSSELKSSWLIVLLQILFTFKSCLISVIHCGRLLYYWCLEAVARPRLISRDRGQDRGSRARDWDEAEAVKILPRGEAVPRGTTSLAISY